MLNNLVQRRSLHPMIGSLSNLAPIPGDPAQDLTHPSELSSRVPFALPFARVRCLCFNLMPPAPESRPASYLQNFEALQQRRNFWGSFWGTAGASLKVLRTAQVRRPGWTQKRGGGHSQTSLIVREAGSSNFLLPYGSFFILCFNSSDSS
jgi:hypothetical protein